MILCRVDRVWRIGSVTNALAKPALSSQVCIYNQRLSYYRKMSGKTDDSNMTDSYKKQTTLTPMWRPIYNQSSSEVKQGVSIENVTKASEKSKGVLEEAVKSPMLDYSHFVSLPLAIHPELVEKLNSFQSFILGDGTSKQDENLDSDSNEDTSDKKDNELEGLDVAVKMEIQDDKEHVKVEIDSKAAKKHASGLRASSFSGLLNNKIISSSVMKKVSPKVMDALDDRPISIRLKGLECMKGSQAKARVLYAPVEEVGGEGRLLRACLITEAYVEAGLVLEKDAWQTLKLHATLMNVRHRKRKKWTRRFDSFDARGIFKKYGSEEWGEYLIREAHLSQRFAFGETGYYQCCGSIPFPGNMQTE